MVKNSKSKIEKKSLKSTSFPAKRSAQAEVIEVKPSKKVELVSARGGPVVTLKNEVKLFEPDSDLPAISTGTGVIARDPLKRYLQEVKNAPVLTAEQETELTYRMREKGDVQAAKLLVSANLKLVVRIAYEYRSMYHNLMDLIQEGNIGLMKAVSKFDPTKGARLPYYATWWVRSYILKYLLDNFRLVRVGTSQAQKKLFYHLMREKQRLEAQGIVAAPALIAQNLDVKEKDVIEMEQRLLGPGAEMSIDAPSPGHPDEPKTSLLNQLFETRENADTALERDEWLQILAKELVGFKKDLNEKETMVLEARVLNDEPKTLQEVADEFGLTRERVRQIESKLIEKLKKRLEPYLK
jgi:RNA polymerase sigma-32 factor